MLTCTACKCWAKPFKLLPSAFYLPLDAKKFDAAASFVFNPGYSKTRGRLIPQIVHPSPRKGNLFRKNRAQTSYPKLKHFRGMDAAGAEGTSLIHRLRIEQAASTAALEQFQG